MADDRSALHFALLGAAVILAGCYAAQGATSRPAAADHGQRLAERHCATCHALTPNTESPLADAPSFPQLRAGYSKSDMAVLLERRMSEFHPRMPLLDMGPDELSAFLAYWEAPTPAAGAAGKARPPSAIERGRAIVAWDCGGCHAIGKSGASAFPGAPPFRTLGARYEIEGLAEALAEGISVGHPAMPEKVYPADEVGAIIAYLKSVQPKGPRPEADNGEQRSQP